MESWKSQAHTSFLLRSQSNILLAPVPVQLQLVGQGKLLRIPPIKASRELLIQSTIWNFYLLLGYVKQTALPCSSMISCIMDLLDTSSSFSLSLMKSACEIL